MVAAASVFTMHTPDTPIDVLALLVVTCITIFFGWRTVGSGYAFVSAGMALVAYAIVGNIAIPLAAMIAAVLLNARVYATGESLRRRGEPFALQMAICLGGLFVYTVARYVVESGGATPFSNTASIVDFERGLGLYVEPDLQSWVMRHDALTRSMNWAYSFAFLAIMTAVLLWLWVVDLANYRLLRNTLGLSAVLAIPTIALFPVAPPRLVTGSGLVDTIAIFGREHAFANEYAAMPSLHVGWMVAAGIVLARSIGGRIGAAVGLALGQMMLVIVIATGNHFWIDGVIGATYTIGSIAFLVNLSAIRRESGLAFVGTAHRLTRAADLTWAVLLERRRALFSFATLGILLAYLILEQQRNPGFTNYWGYMVGQVAIIMTFLVVAEIVFAKEGGLSWWTHLIAVSCTYADVLGTDGNLYARIDEYDKLTHFAGVAALTAMFYDSLRALYRRGTIVWNPTERLTLAIAVGVAMGIAWEVYELLGDKVFHTARVNSRWDTANDIVSDSLGAITLALLLWFGETRASRWQNQPAGLLSASAPEEMADLVSHTSSNAD